MRGVELRLAPEPGWVKADAVIVAIAGGSGSGKTWLARRIVEILGARRAGIVCQDSFYRDLSHLAIQERLAMNFDHPSALDWPAYGKCLRQVASGKAGRIPRYNFKTHARDPGEVAAEPRPVMIFEGLWALRRAESRRHFEMSVFIDAKESLCLQRRLARDRMERGRCESEVRDWFFQRVLPMQRRFVEPQRKHASLILAAPITQKQARQLADRILSMADVSRLQAR